MSDIGAVFDILMNNRKDIEEVIEDLGGISATLELAAKLVGPISRIIQTASKHSDPVAAVETAHQTILYYDDNTKASVRLFQEKYGLHQDGIVGNQTWEKVEEIDR